MLFQSSLLELPSSLVNRRQIHQWCKGPKNRGKFHPIFGWVEHPKSQYFEKNRPGNNPWVLHNYNERGFRDQYDKGKHGVIVLGDSFMRGTLVKDHQTVAHHLDWWDRNYSFHNLGVGGTGTAQQYLIYKHLAERIDHQYVILAYYFNDLLDNMRTDKDPRRPKFKLQNGNLILSYKPRKPGEKNSSPTFIHESLDLVKKNSAVYAILWGFLERYLFESIKTTIPKETQIREGLKLTKHIISRLVKQVKIMMLDLWSWEFLQD